MNHRGFELTPKSWTCFKEFHEEVQNSVQAQRRLELLFWRHRSEADTVAIRRACLLRHSIRDNVGVRLK